MKKKILLMILSILFIGSAITGGVLLANGHSQSETISGGGNSQNDNSDDIGEDDYEVNAQGYYLHAYTRCFDQSYPTGANNTNGGNVTCWGPGLFGIWDDSPHGRGTAHAWNGAEKNEGEVVTKVNYSSGYRLIGYYTDSSCNSPFYPSTSNKGYDSNDSDGQVSTGHYTLTADTDSIYVKLARHVTFNFSAQGGGTLYYRNDHGTQSAGSTHTIGGYFGDTSTFQFCSVGTSAGFSFNGWYCGSSLVSTSVSYFNTYNGSTNIFRRSYSSGYAQDDGNNGLKYNFEARFTANTYSVSFNSNGGSSVSSKNVTYGSTYGTLTTPTRSGCSFDGWFLNSDFTGGKVTSSTVVSTPRDHTLYAKWIDNQAPTISRVTWAQNDDNSYYAYAYATDNVGVDRVQFPTWTEYNGQDDLISGWETSSAASGTRGSWTVNGQTYNYRYLVNVSDHKNEYGRYRTHVYVYDAAGHSDADGTTLDSIYLNWNITFNGNGGTTPGNLNYNGTDNKTLPTLLRTGYNFRGWKPSASSGSWNSSTNYLAGASCNGHHGTVTLVAQWELITYTITFDSNGGAVYGLSSASRNYTITGTTGTNFITSLPTPRRNGHTFAGWELVGNSGGNGSWMTDEGYPAGYSLLNSYGNVTLRARWIVNEYDNTYNYLTANGTLATANQIRTYGQNFTTYTNSNLSNPYIANDWNLKGWSLSQQSYLIDFAAGASVSSYNNSLSDSTFYAVNERDISVIYDKNGGSGSTTNYSNVQLWNSYSRLVYNISSVNVANFNLTKAGFKFNGWNTAPDGSGRVYNAGDPITFNFYEQGSITLYAQWSAGNSAYPNPDSDTVDYWYINLGKMPQTRMVDEAVIANLNALTTTTGVAYTMGGVTLDSFAYNGEEYCKWNENWYKVEPIRWRIEKNTNQGAGFGTETDTYAIMDTIVFLGQFSNTKLDEQNSSSTLIDEYLSNDNNGITTVTNESQVVYNEYLTNFDASVDKFSQSGTIKQVQNAHIFISSQEEIENICDGDMSVEFSDLVADMIIANGNILLYYTRDLGDNINNITCLNSAGSDTQREAQEVLGVRFTIKVTEYGCVE